MTSSSRVITKILIDYDQYLKLKNYEKQIEELNAKKTDDLKIIKEKDDSFVDHEKKQEQTGSGLQLPDDFFEKLSTSITNQISQKFNLDALQQLLPTSNTNSSSLVSQTGEGANDLFPPAPSFTSLDVSQPPAFDATNQKSQQYDKFDNNKLISLVPQKFHKRAQILLNNIQEIPLEIDYNTKGELFIDGECIPNANIYKIFPQLYVRKIKKTLPGKDELVTKIASKGWGKLIVRGILKGLKRPPKYKLHKDTTSSVKEFKNWWYLSM
jgi:hypothetical protein